MTPTPGKRSRVAEKPQPAKRTSAVARREVAEPAAVAPTRSRTRKQAAAPAAAAVVPVVGKRTGRRPGVSGSRQAIIDAARAKFAERGYEGATIRAIAHEAGVDAALIHHFFETKEGVFAAAMQNAFHPGDLLPPVLEPGIDGLGERLVRMFLDLWDSSPSRDALLAIVRSAVSHPDAAALLRSFVSNELLGQVAKAIDRPDPELRTSLVSSQLIGFAFLRYVVGIEPLASLDKEQIVRLIAPTVQRYLADDLPEIGKPARRSRARRVS